MAGPLVLPEIYVGMIEQSMTRSPSAPMLHVPVSWAQQLSCLIDSRISSSDWTARPGCTSSAIIGTTALCAKTARKEFERID